MTADVTTHDARAARWAAMHHPAGPAWLHALRRAAYERFEALGFPSTRTEAWRHTDVARIARGTFATPDAMVPAAAARLADRVLLPGVGPRLVFVNGRFAPGPSAVSALPPGAVVMSLASALAAPPAWLEAHYGRVAATDAHAFTALATALATDGAVVYLPRGAAIADPVQVVFLSTGGGAAAVEWHARVLVVAEEGARATLVEVHAGDGAGFSNTVSELVLAPGAAVDHVKVQVLPPGALHTASTCAQLGRDARCNSASFAFGAALARNEFEAAFTAPGGECTLDGLWIGSGTQHLDNQTFVDHAQPDCQSRQLYKGILTGSAHGVFTGRVLVRADAQRTSAHQTNRNLLLSEGALVDTRPQLEILADDVQCTHGATIGRLDEESLFYLRSRGIGTADARAMLVRAFAQEVVSRVRPEGVRAGIEGILLAHLPGAADVAAAAEGSPS